MAEEQEQQCIFCHIANGKVAAKKVYEDEHLIGVLDINPANPGHVLLITKEHYQIMPQVPADVTSRIGMVAKQLSRSMLRALQAEGTNIFIANGAVAGQRAPHVMVHVIPRKGDDGVTGFDIPERQITPDQLMQLKQALAPGVKKAFDFDVVLEEAPVEEPEETEEETTEETEDESEEQDEEADEADDEEKDEDDSEDESSDEDDDEEPKESGKLDLDDIADFLTGGKQ